MQGGAATGQERTWTSGLFLSEMIVVAIGTSCLLWRIEAASSRVPALEERRCCCLLKSWLEPVEDLLKTLNLARLFPGDLQVA